MGILITVTIIVYMLGLLTVLVAMSGMVAASFMSRIVWVASWVVKRKLGNRQQRNFRPFQRSFQFVLELLGFELVVLSLELFSVCHTVRIG